MPEPCHARHTLWRRILVRLGIFAASLFAASFVVFLLCNALPGDIAQTILGQNADKVSVEALRSKLGLNRAWPLRYLEWLGGMLSGNLGTSYLSGKPVAALIAPKLAVTGWLVGFAMVLATLIALPLGMFAAVRRRRLSGLVASSLAHVGMAVPAFFVGVLLVLLFSVYLRWLPANGYVALFVDPYQWARHLVLPVVALALVQASVLSRYVRTSTIEVVREDYFRTARAVGWQIVPALWRHGLRNIGISVITVLGLQLATLLVGAIVVESVFALPGLGMQLLDAVRDRDLAVVQGIVMLLVGLVLVINALVDVAYLLIDPRLRMTGEVE